MMGVYVYSVQAIKKSINFRLASKGDIFGQRVERAFLSLLFEYSLMAPSVFNMIFEMIDLYHNSVLLVFPSLYIVDQTRIVMSGG